MVGVSAVATKSTMQRYIRVISKEPTDSADDLRRVLDLLLAAVPGTSEFKLMSPHSKGGFSLFLEFADDEIQELLVFLSDNGWAPCF